jgi:hypothetical protein
MSTFSFNVTGLLIDGAQVTIGSPWPIITYVGFKFFMLSKKIHDFYQKILNGPKEMNVVSTKEQLQFFPPVCPFARFIFTLSCLGMF